MCLPFLGNGQDLIVDSLRVVDSIAVERVASGVEFTCEEMKAFERTLENNYKEEVGAWRQIAGEKSNENLCYYYEVKVDIRAQFEPNPPEGCAYSWISDSWYVSAYDYSVYLVRTRKSPITNNGTIICEEDL
ncbi:MAG: hypothetical protein SchgKO_11160 [Schleiferiaceae bacterium]